jgi:iron(III) transport system substrate-binding protein
MITDWFLTAGGQNAIVDGWMHSVLNNFPRNPYDAPPIAQIKAKNMPVNWENCFRQREEIRTKFEELVNRKR